MADKNDPDSSGDGTIKLSAVTPANKKSTPQRATAAKVTAIPKAAIVKPKVVASMGDNDDDRPMKVVLKKREFVERMMAYTEANKNQAKEVFEAVLTVLGEALENGEELQLPPLGKIKVQNTKDRGEGIKVHTLKVRTPKA